MTPILADGGANVLVGVVVLAFFLIGQVISTLSKQKKEREDREKLKFRPRAIVETPPLARQQQQPPQRSAVRGVRSAGQALRRQAEEAARALTRMTTPPAAPPRRQGPPRLQPAGPPAYSDPAPPHRTVEDSSVPARKQRRGLARELQLALRPRNVKTQFVLNELLNKPLSLRDEPNR